MWNTSTYFRRVVTQSWCAFIFEQGRGVYHKITFCSWVMSGFLPSGHLTRAWQLLWQTKTTLQGMTFLVFVFFQCCYTQQLHITNVSLQQRSAPFSHIKHRYWCWKRALRANILYHALTVTTENLIIWTGRHIWVEPKPTLQDRRWIHKQWVRCWLVTGDAWVQFALPTQTLSLELSLFSNKEMWLQEGKDTSASFPPANYGIGCKYLPTKAIQTCK